MPETPKPKKPSEPAVPDLSPGRGEPAPVTVFTGSHGIDAPRSRDDDEDDPGEGGLHSRGRQD